ncbi:MAG TPA: penicillin-binding protein 1C [Myxococcota bacterium]|nr:penicillin-binding protein 1C [Myxococcota bacterium]
MTHDRTKPASGLRQKLLWLMGGATVLVFVLAAWVAAVPFPLGVLERPTHTSTLILDRDGRLLREVLSVDETRGRWVSLDEVADVLELATIHAEDRRFHEHPGIDSLAIARSLWIDLSTGEARTGASTITQQLVKLTLQRGEPRTLSTKLMEIIWAWRLELAATKDRILEEYLNRIPYGNQLVGIEAASRGYFDKPASALSLAEAAYLAGLPSAPSRHNPYRFPERARARQRWLLDLMLERGAIDRVSFDAAVVEPLALKPRGGPHLAPHLTSQITSKIKTTPPDQRPPQLETTIDTSLQRAVEDIVRRHQPDPDRTARPQALQAAVLILDTQTSEVLAWVGSRDFRDQGALGENDGVTAARQPGSALKPFIYGLWLDRGGHPDELLDDSPRAFATPTGPYRPENYDRLFRGPVTPRTALGSSLNVPAVDVLERVGVPSMVAHLASLGLRFDEPPEHYGLGLALGNAEVRLVDLAGAYATLGRLGEHRPVTWTRAGNAQPERVLSARSAYAILDMLADDRARGVGFGLAGPFDLPYRVAAKTGTSSDFKDNWAFAVTPRHTVGVWVGHFEGTPMGESPGRFGAAPLAREVLHTLYPRASRRGDVPWFAPPEARDLNAAGF